MMSSFRPDPDYASRGFVPSVSSRSESNGRGTVFRAASASASSDGQDTEDSIGAETGEESREVVESWTSEQVERLEHEAFERGVESARKAAETLDRACDALEAGASSLLASSRAAVSCNRDLMLELASEIARSWVGEERALDQGLFGRMLDRALGDCAAQGPARLFLNPADHAALLEAAEDRLDGWREAYGMDVVDDASMGPGEFRIEAERGFVDGRDEAVLKRLRDALRPAVGQEIETETQAEVGSA